MAFSNVLISGAGFLADAYDLFVINIAVDLMSQQSYEQPLSNTMKSTIKTMALVGAVVGQLGFGAIADLIGRRRVFIATCFLVIVGALLSAAAVDNSFGIYTQLCVYRFVLGVGVGGEYPLSASITSESSAGTAQQRNLAMVFAMQGLGTLLCSLVLVAVTRLMGDNYDAQWRLALSLGALPMICAFYFRWQMHETSWQHEALPAATTATATDPPRTYWTTGLQHLRTTLHTQRWPLLGTAGAWFILDVVFYANGLFSGQVTAAMGVSSSPCDEALASLALQLVSIPGYLCTVAFIDRIGAKRLQMVGFMATALFFMLLAGWQPLLVQAPAAYLAVYGITFFFQNFGANATTYIIPSVVFPSAQRATCHGLSAAAGKLGAIVGAQLFLYLTDSFCAGDVCGDDAPASQVSAGLQTTFCVCSLLALLGLAWTHWLVTDQLPCVGVSEVEVELVAVNPTREA